MHLQKVIPNHCTKYEENAFNHHGVGMFKDRLPDGQINGCTYQAHSHIPRFHYSRVGNNKKKCTKGVFRILKTAWGLVDHGHSQQNEVDGRCLGFFPE